MAYGTSIFAAVRNRDTAKNSEGDGINSYGSSAITNGFQVSSSSVAQYVGDEYTGNYAQGGSIVWTLTVTVNSVAEPTYTAATWNGAYNCSASASAAAPAGEDATAVGNGDDDSLNENVGAPPSATTSSSLPVLTTGTVTLSGWTLVSEGVYQATATLITNNVTTEGVYSVPSTAGHLLVSGSGQTKNSFAVSSVSLSGGD